MQIREERVAWAAAVQGSRILRENLVLNASIRNRLDILQIQGMLEAPSEVEKFYTSIAASLNNDLLQAVNDDGQRWFLVFTTAAWQTDTAMVRQRGLPYHIKSRLGLSLVSTTWIKNGQKIKPICVVKPHEFEIQSALAVAGRDSFAVGYLMRCASPATAEEVAVHSLAGQGVVGSGEASDYSHLLLEVGGRLSGLVIPDGWMDDHVISMFIVSVRG